MDQANQKPITLDQISTIKLEPGEKLLVRFRPDGINDERVAQNIFRGFQQHFGNNVVVLIGDVEITKLIPAEPRLKRFLRNLKEWLSLKN